MTNFFLFANEDIFLVAGIALILLVVLQMSFWVGGAFNRYLADKQKLKLKLKILEQKLNAAKVERQIVEGESAWNGLRSFRVSKLVQESTNIRTIYLTPQDRRPLPFFRPGQYLTFSFEFPHEKKPVVRCYSLSDAPNAEFYRCTVKKVDAFADPTHQSTGLVSTYLNDELQEGDIVQVKAPGGQFYLDLDDNQPVILLAGGIGITPLYSMLASIVKFQPHRRVVLFYGAKNSREQALRSEINGIVNKHRNVHVVNCFSDPLDADKIGSHYDVKGWVTPELLKSTLPSNNFQFFACGPNVFMSSLVDGLIDWGVPMDHIHTEAFGPSSVSCVKSDLDDPTEMCDRPACKIRFTRSSVEVDFDSRLESILEAAEQVGVDIDSGCRAGNCGSCEISILKGKAKYLKNTGLNLSEGHALSCVTRPDGDVEVDA